MNWFIKYKDKLGVRYAAFEKLFNIAEERNLKTIIETGTARGKSKFYYRKPNSHKAIISDGVYDRQKDCEDSAWFCLFAKPEELEGTGFNRRDHCKTVSIH